MAKARTRKRTSELTVPVAVIGGFMPLLHHAIAGYQENGVEGLGRFTVSALTGYDTGDHQWRPMEMRRGTIPILLGMAVHKYVGGKLGVNRALARAGVPLLRL